MQKSSLYHQFSLEIQPILEFFVQSGQPIFDHSQPKIIEATFPEFAVTCPGISLFYQFVLDIQATLESRDQSDHTHF